LTKDGATTQQIKTPKEKMLEFASHNNIVIAFRDDLKISRRDLVIPWSDDKISTFTIGIETETTDDNTILKINPYILNTRMNAPDLV